MLSPQPWIITAGLFVSISSGQRTTQNQARGGSSLESPGAGSSPDSTTHRLCGTRQRPGLPWPSSWKAGKSSPGGPGGLGSKPGRGVGLEAGRRGEPDWAPRATCPGWARGSPPGPPPRCGCCSANGLPPSELRVRPSLLPSARPPLGDQRPRPRGECDVAERVSLSGTAPPSAGGCEDAGALSRRLPPGMGRGARERGGPPEPEPKGAVTREGRRLRAAPGARGAEPVLRPGKRGRRAPWPGGRGGRRVWSRGPGTWLRPRQPPPCFGRGEGWGGWGRPGRGEGHRRTRPVGRVWPSRRQWSRRVRLSAFGSGWRMQWGGGLAGCGPAVLTARPRGPCLSLKEASTKGPPPLLPALPKPGVGLPQTCGLQEPLEHLHGSDVLEWKPSSANNVQGNLESVARPQFPSQGQVDRASPSTGKQWL